MKQNQLFVALQHLKYWLLILISFSGVLCFAPPIDLICQDCKKEPCECDTVLPDPGTDSSDPSYYIYIGIAIFLILVVTALVIYRKRSIAKIRINFGDK